MSIRITPGSSSTKAAAPSVPARATPGVVRSLRIIKSMLAAIVRIRETWSKLTASDIAFYKDGPRAAFVTVLQSKYGFSATDAEFALAKIERLHEDARMSGLEMRKALSADINRR